MQNTFGNLFRVTTFGESHGVGIGCVIDGCPAGVSLSEQDIQTALDRRKPGQSSITTQRKEADRVQIQSGVFEGITTGSPISLFIANEDAHSADYSEIANTYRPSHADYTWETKYGHRDYRGGGRSSARETAARVAAGAVAQALLQHLGIEVKAYVQQVFDIAVPVPYTELDLGLIDSNIVRCPHPETAEKMITAIEAARDAGDSLGGYITCIAKNVPVGWGEPVFDKLPALLGHAVLSINAVKGIAFGDGFESAYLKGSQHNDTFYTNAQGEVKTRTNHAGGTLGGISNGEDIYFTTAFKPTATIMQAQETITKAGEATILNPKGRHDPCVLPRAVPIVEAMTWLVLADCYLMERGNRV
jgi:chorismate synthase